MNRRNPSWQGYGYYDDLEYAATYANKVRSFSSYNITQVQSQDGVVYTYYGNDADGCCKNPCEYGKKLASNLT
jgi:hypothetical protein